MYVEHRSFFISALVLNCVCFQQNHRIICIVICYVLFKFTLSTDLKYLENMCRQQFSNNYDFTSLLCNAIVFHYHHFQGNSVHIMYSTFNYIYIVRMYVCKEYYLSLTMKRPMAIVLVYSYIKQYISANHNRDMYHYFLHKSTQANQRFTWFCIVVETKVLQIKWKHTPIIQ